MPAALGAFRAVTRLSPPVAGAWTRRIGCEKSSARHRRGLRSEKGPVGAARRAARPHPRSRQDPGRRLPHRQPRHRRARRRPGRDRHLHPHRFGHRRRPAGAPGRPVHPAGRPGTGVGGGRGAAGGRAGRPAGAGALEDARRPPPPRSLSRFQNTNIPELRFRALLTDGARGALRAAKSGLEQAK